MTWLVEDLIPETGVTLLTGDSGCGKSTLTLALAGAVAHGKQFLGRKTIQRDVLIVDRENSPAIHLERLHRLRIAETPRLRIWGTWNDHEPDASSSALIDYAKRNPLIVIDSLVAFHPGSEQDSSETRKYMNGFRRLAAKGATVLVIHHIGKSESAQHYRGSSDIKASVDSAFLLKSADPNSVSSLVLTPFKQRIGDSSPIRIECVDGVFQQSGKTNPQIVEDLIQETPGMKGSDIVAAAMRHGVAKHRAAAILSAGGDFQFPNVSPYSRETGKQA
jgi:predicted ATP-dependent serine protease